MARDLVDLAALATLAALTACGAAAPPAAPPHAEVAPPVPAPPAPAEAAPADPAPAAATATPLAETDASRVALEPITNCAPDARCEVRLVVHALGAFDVNEDYPTKFVAAADSAPVEGTGTFEPAGKTGVLTLALRPHEGTTRVSGVFKYSVCTEDVCKIEEPAIAFEVPGR